LGQVHHRTIVWRTTDFSECLLTVLARASMRSARPFSHGALPASNTSADSPSPSQQSCPAALKGGGVDAVRLAARTRVLLQVLVRRCDIDSGNAWRFLPRSEDTAVRRSRNRRVFHAKRSWGDEMGFRQSGHPGNRCGRSPASRRRHYRPCRTDRRHLAVAARLAR
jgi:hypothetical protein